MPQTRNTVIIGVYPETRRRINAHAGAKCMTQAEYLDSLVPAVPGEQLAKTD